MEYYTTPDRMKSEELIGRRLRSIRSGVDMGVICGVREDCLVLNEGTATIRRGGYGEYFVVDNNGGK